MKPVLTDTGFIVALLDRSETHHKICADIAATIQQPLITCEAVIAESCFLTRNFKGAGKLILAFIEDGFIQIPWMIKGNESVLATLISKYANIPMSLADACLVAMADSFNTDEVLTLDSDFGHYRWRNKKPFKQLLLK